LQVVGFGLHGVGAGSWFKGVIIAGSRSQHAAACS
jgi:hypothetical protein